MSPWQLTDVSSKQLLVNFLNRQSKVLSSSPRQSKIQVNKQLSRHDFIGWSRLRAVFPPGGVEL